MIFIVTYIKGKGTHETVPLLQDCQNTTKNNLNQIKTTNYMKIDYSFLNKSMLAFASSLPSAII